MKVFPAKSTELLQQKFAMNTTQNMKVFPHGCFPGYILLVLSEVSLIFIMIFQQHFHCWQQKCAGCLKKQIFIFWRKQCYKKHIPGGVQFSDDLYCHSIRQSQKLNIRHASWLHLLELDWFAIVENLNSLQVSMKQRSFSISTKKPSSL